MSADARAADVPGAETASDRGPGDRTVSDGPRDLGPLPDVCGGSRTLSPTTVAPYAAKPCGTGCKQVTFGNFVEQDYEVAGNLLAYVGSLPTGAFKVYLVDLTTGTERMLENYQGSLQGCSLVSTDGQKLVYTWATANADLYHHDLSNGTTTRVTTDPGTQERPDVWDDWVAWQDWRNSPGGLSQGGQAANSDVYAKNLKTGQEVQLTSFAGHEAYVRVDNGRVFFRMLDGKNRASVFMIDLKTRLGL